MFYPEHIIQDIISTAKLSQIIAGDTKLISQGNNKYKALCPFHNEKTPSFTIDDNKNMYYCFGCHKGGNIFKYLEEKQNLKFFEAVQKLASMYGIALPTEEKKDSNEDEKYRQAHKIMQLSCDFYRDKLLKDNNIKALAYLKTRNFNLKIIKEFGIGYAPYKDKLYKYLSPNYDAKILDDLGLTVQKDNLEIIDRFRDRIIFPIHDTKGQVIAFGARVLGDSLPKYLNSPETFLFKKGKILFNYHRAKQYCVNKPVILTEGYADVVSLAAHGIENVVASLGTAVTSGQLKLCSYLSKDIIIMTDGDEAGRNAMERIALLFLENFDPALNLKFAQLPENNDPDDVLRKEGAIKIYKIINEALPLSEFLWQNYSAKYDISVPESKASLNNELTGLCAKISDANLASAYREYFKKQLWQAGFSGKKINISGKHLIKNLSNIDSDLNSFAGCEIQISALIANYPHLLENEEIFERYILIDFSSDKLDKIREYILDIKDFENHLTCDKIYSYLTDKGHGEYVVCFESLKNDNGLTRLSDAKKLNNAKIQEDNNYPAEKDPKLLIKWEYLYNRYYLLNMKKEYLELLNQMTEQSMNQAFSLSKAISESEIKLNKLELSLAEL